jgi:hypothetical protein
LAASSWSCGRSCAAPETFDRSHQPISRERVAQLGAETQRNLAERRYTNAQGVVVELGALLDTAVASTQSYPAEQVLLAELPGSYQTAITIPETPAPKGCRVSRERSQSSESSSTTLTRAPLLLSWVSGPGCHFTWGTSALASGGRLL